MIPLDKLQEMSKEEIIEAFLRLQQEYASQNKLYLNLADENGAVVAATAQKHQENAALRQEYTNLQNAHSALNDEHEKLKAAHSELQKQRPKRKWFFGLFR